MMREYPLLFPAGGEVQARQKFRESRVAFDIAPGKRTSLIQSTLLRRDKQRDMYLHLGTDHEPLFRMERQSPHGKLIFQLMEIDRVSVLESPRVH